MKKRIIGFTIAASLLVGGTVGFATASMFDELKDDYYKEIKSHMESFVPVDHSKRVQDETRAHLKKRLAEYDKSVNDLRKREADQAIKDINRFIDAEIATYKNK